LGAVIINNTLEILIFGANTTYLVSLVSLTKIKSEIATLDFYTSIAASDLCTSNGSVGSLHLCWLISY